MKQLDAYKFDIVNKKGPAVFIFIWNDSAQSTD